MQIFREDGLISWEKNVTENVVRYSWPNIINGNPMDLVHNGTTIQGIMFNEFVFLNPFSIVEPELCMISDKSTLHEIYATIIVFTLIVYFTVWSYCKR
jgi:hypothetical protein